MTSDIKALWPWQDADANKHLAVGMTGGLTTIEDDEANNRSPRFYEYNTTIDFSTTADNRHDNRIVNLRSVTDGQNKKNRPKQKNNSTGTPGVIWNPLNNNWVARISVKSRTVHIGCYNRKNDAIMARKEAEKFYGFHENHGREQSAEDKVWNAYSSMVRKKFNE